MKIEEVFCVNRKLCNKGFTLIELLAVFIILLSVSFVAVGSVMSFLEKREVDECIEQQKMAVSAAKIYFSLEGTGLSSVSVSSLKSLGYIDEKDKSDLLNGDDMITVDSAGYKYNGGMAGDSCS